MPRQSFIYVGQCRNSLIPKRAVTLERDFRVAERFGDFPYAFSVDPVAIYRQAHYLCLVIMLSFVLERVNKCLPNG